MSKFGFKKYRLGLFHIFRFASFSLVAFLIWGAALYQAANAEEQKSVPILAFLTQIGLHFESSYPQNDGVISIKSAYFSLGTGKKIDIEKLLITPKDNGGFDFDISNITYSSGVDFNLARLKISDLKLNHPSNTTNKLAHLSDFLNSLLNLDIAQIDFEKMFLISAIGETGYLVKFTMDAGSFEMVSKGIAQSQYFWGSQLEIGKKTIQGVDYSTHFSIDHFNFRELNLSQVFDLLFVQRNNEAHEPKAIAKSANIRHISFYDNSQMIDFDELNLSNLLLRQNRETVADLLNNQAAFLVMENVERGKDGQPLVEDPLADYKYLKLMRSYFYLLDMVEAVDLDFKDYAKEHQDGVMEYQFLIDNGSVSYQKNKLTFQFNQINDVAKKIEHPTSFRFFNLNFDWQIDSVQAENINFSNIYNLINNEFSTLLEKDGLNKNSNIDYSEVLLPKIWQNFPQIDSLSVHKLALFDSSDKSNDSNKALQHALTLDKLSLKNKYETSGPIPTNIELEVSNFALPKKIVSDTNILPFKNSPLNVSLQLKGNWNKELNALTFDDSFIESKQLGRLTIYAKFSNVVAPLFSGRQADMLGNLVNIIVNKLVLRYEDRGLKNLSLSLVAQASDVSLDAVKTKAVDTFKERLAELKLDDRETENYVNGFATYLQTGRGLELKFQEKTVNSGSIAVIIAAFWRDRSLFWSLFDIDLVSLP